jgi:hypothetical protein
VRDAATRSGLRRAVALGVGATATALVVVRASRHPGGDDAGRALPGDELALGATSVTTRSVRIAAPPSAVWPWLVQMGYGRGGWYAVDLLERMIGAGDFATGGSADRVVPELQHLAVGDRVALDASHHLVVARVAPPPQRPAVLVLALPAEALTWVWSFTLWPEAEGTRLVVRTHVGVHQRWLRPVLPALDVGHAVMGAVQLRRLRRRVERTVRADVTGDRGDDAW